MCLTALSFQKHCEVSAIAFGVTTLALQPSCNFLFSETVVTPCSCQMCLTTLRFQILCKVSAIAMGIATLALQPSRMLLLSETVIALSSALVALTTFSFQKHCEVSPSAFGVTTLARQPSLKFLLFETVIASSSCLFFTPSEDCRNVVKQFLLNLLPQPLQCQKPVCLQLLHLPCVMDLLASTGP